VGTCLLVFHNSDFKWDDRLLQLSLAVLRAAAIIVPTRSARNVSDMLFPVFHILLTDAGLPWCSAKAPQKRQGPANGEGKASKKAVPGGTKRQHVEQDAPENLPRTRRTRAAAPTTHDAAPPYIQTAMFYRHGKGPLHEEEHPHEEVPQSVPSPQHAIPKVPVQACEPLNPEGLTALENTKDPQCHAYWVKTAHHDDHVAEIASQRGLLVRFVVKTVVPKPALVVEAPEFATVEYLKRRITKAKLMCGKFLAPANFVLRRNTQNEAGEVRGLEDVVSHDATGNEVFLADAGFEAPATYELIMASAPRTTDKEQQAAMLVGGSGAMQGGPQALSPERLAYRALLEAPRQPARRPGPPGHHPTLPGAPAPGVLQPSASTAVAPRPAAVVSPEGKLRRQRVRWQPDEVDALIAGVQAFGTCWSQIYEHYATGATPRINPARTQTDLKDKWRNLAKLVTQPGKQPRMDLSEEVKDTILRLVCSQDVNAAQQGECLRQEGCCVCCWLWC
jgi:Myb-like DNA-binding domain